VLDDADGGDDVEMPGREGDRGGVAKQKVRKPPLGAELQGLRGIVHTPGFRAPVLRALQQGAGAAAHVQKRPQRGALAAHRQQAVNHRAHANEPPVGLFQLVVPLVLVGFQDPPGI